MKSLVKLTKNIMKKMKDLKRMIKKDFKMTSVSINRNVLEKFDELREFDGLSRSSRIELMMREELKNRNIQLH